MQKGFTLVELLAIIAILAIILLIAIPKIVSVVTNSKINALNRNEDMLVKAAINFISFNDGYVPLNPGDFVEIKLADLQTAKYITDIRNPYGSNNCNGYVKIYKNTDETLEYTPYLYCSTNTITSSVEDKMIAHYKIKNNLIVNYNGSTTATISGAVYGVDRFNNTNNALSFDGVNDYVDLGYGATFNPTLTPITVSVWFKMNNAITTDKMVFSAGQVPTAAARFYMGNTASKWDFGVGATSWGSGTTIAANNNWTHAVITMSGTTAKQYINGALHLSKTYASYAFNRNIYLGQNDSSYWFQGLIDDVRIYNRALDDNEIRDLYNEGALRTN